MIRRFQDVSPQLEVEFVDPLRQPLMAIIRITEYGAVVLGPRQETGFADSVERAGASAGLVLEQTIVWWSLGAETLPDDAQSEDGLGNRYPAGHSLRHEVHILTQGIDPECEIL